MTSTVSEALMIECGRFLESSAKMVKSVLHPESLGADGEDGKDNHGDVGDNTSSFSALPKSMLPQRILQVHRQHPNPKRHRKELAEALAVTTTQIHPTLW